MKKRENPDIPLTLLILLSVFAAGCNRADGEKTPPNIAETAKTASILLDNVAVETPSMKTTGSQSIQNSATVALTKVDLILSVDPQITGTITAEIRDASRTTVLGSSTVQAADLLNMSGMGGWVTFAFSPPLSLEREQKYTILLTRSDRHNPGTRNAVYWRSSGNNTNPYPDGTNDPGWQWNLDYGFRTYNSDQLDQEQASNAYGFYLDSYFQRWQEFVVDHHRLNRVDLYMLVTQQATGTITAEIRDATRTVVLGSSTVRTSDLAGASQFSGWAAFSFSPALNLQRGQKYAILLTRSDVHNNQTNNTVYWNCSSAFTNPYPDGTSDPGPSWNLDYAFTTYRDNQTDQKQTSHVYGFGVPQIQSPRWQEFLFAP